MDIFLIFPEINFRKFIAVICYLNSEKAVYVVIFEEAEISIPDFPVIASTYYA